MKPHFRLDTHPLADPANVVAGDRFRVTVLDEGLVRLEYSESGEFEDRASQTVLNRAFPPTRFTREESDGRLEIHTERLHLVYDKGPFTTHGLSVQAKGGYHSHDSVWRFGLDSPNLGGTARTLDDVDGAIPLEDGVLARDGVALVDDSGTVLLTDDGWIAPRRPGTHDLYVFAYGRDYKAALRALYALTGPPPLLPRYALGNWWSRYHPYTAEEYLALVDRFRAERVPLSVAVIDMDWHWVDIDPAYGSGWTGYTWNTELFPDPKGFLTSLHERGLAVSLNVHPAEGVHAHEAAYPRIAERLGIDPASRLPVGFDPTDPVFVEAYLEELHHPLEDEGVDFWWLDWQQGGVTKLPGLDPLWLLNHLHFLDSGRVGPASADVLPLRRDRQPPLPDRLLRRYLHHLGVARLPARVHRDRLQRRLRLVEPRHRRPLPRLPGRRAGHPVGPAGGVLPGQPAALGPEPVQHQGAVAVQPGRGVGDDRLPAAAAPAAAVPGHHEPARPPRASPWCSRCTTTIPTSRRRTRCRTSSCSEASCWSRRSPLPLTGRPGSAGSGPGCPRGPGPTCSPVFATPVAAPSTCIATCPRSRSWPGPARSSRWLPSRTSPAARSCRRRSSCGCTPARTASSRWPRTVTTDAGPAPGSATTTAPAR